MNDACYELLKELQNDVVDSVMNEVVVAQARNVIDGIKNKKIVIKHVNVDVEGEKAKMKM